MERRAQILGLIYQAVDEANDQLAEGQRLVKSPDTPLIGDAACLDSLGLVELIVSVEEAIADELGIPVTIADERAFSKNRSPFRTIGTMTDHVCELLPEVSHD